MEIGAGTSLGRYQLRSEIGRGAMGVVFQALDPEIDRLVAIKVFSVLEATGAEGEAFRERFAREARAAGRLMHPGIVTVYDVGESESGIPFIVMEHVPGQPLSRMLTATATRLEERFALQLAKEVAEALGYAHEKRVVHRDVKPANILITGAGAPKITDFGVAHLDLSNLTLRGESFGTPAYMAPEQLTGAPADGRSDLFSLGVILYTMLIGFRPFQGNSAKTISYKVINQEPVPVASFHLDLSKDTEYVVARAMAKQPEARYQTGWEFAADLEDILGGREPRSRRKHSVPVSAEVFRVAEGYRTLAAIKRPVVSPPTESSVPDAVVPRANGIANSPAPHTHSASMPSRHWNARSVRRFAPLAVTVSGLATICMGVLIMRAERVSLRAADQQIGVPPYVQENLPRPAAVRAGAAVMIRADGARDASKAVTTREGEVPVLDYTVVHGVENPTRISPAKLVKTTAAAPVSVLPVGRTALLQVVLHHHFRQAELSVWVDGKLAYSGAAYGQARKHLLVLHGVNATETYDLRLSEGEHDFRVRVASSASHYDASQMLHADLHSARKSVLEIDCGRQAIKLKLGNAS